jgi:hypothetical protein
VVPTWPARRAGGDLVELVAIWWPVRCAAADLVARPLVAFLVELVAWCRPGQRGALVAFLVAFLVEPVAQSFRAQKARGFDDLAVKAQQPRPSLVSGFLFFPPVLRGAWLIFGGLCGGTRKGAPVPLPGSSTPHGLPPLFDDKGAVFRLS